MRRFVRIILPVAAAAMMALAGSSTAFAGSSVPPTSLDRGTTVQVLKSSQTTVSEGGIVDPQSRK
jgi:hypothetical protein